MNLSNDDPELALESNPPRSKFWPKLAGEQLLAVPVEAGKEDTIGSRMRRRSPVSRRMATKRNLFYLFLLSNAHLGQWSLA